MLRVREVPARVFARDGEVLAATSGKVKLAGRSPSARLLALAALGIALGSGGMVLTASMVQAESEGSAREFLLQRGVGAACRIQAGVDQQDVHATAPRRMPSNCIALALRIN